MGWCDQVPGVLPEVQRESVFTKVVGLNIHYEISFVVDKQLCAEKCHCTVNSMFCQVVV